MSQQAFLVAVWRAIGSYVVHVDTLATPANARTYLALLTSPVVALAPAAWKYGATPDPLAAFTAFEQGLPPPMRPEIVREMRSWALLARDSPFYNDADADAAAWYARAQKLVALADDAAPTVTDAASLALAQVLAVFRDSYLVAAARTFVVPPARPLYQPNVFATYDPDGIDPPVYTTPDPVPIDRTGETGLMPLGQRWALLTQRVQDTVDLATRQLGL